MIKSNRIVWLTTISCCLAAGQLRADEELARDASWDFPAASAVKEQLSGWLEQLDVPAERRAEIDELWASTDGLVGRFLLDRVVRTAGMADERAAKLVKFCSPNTIPTALLDTEWLADEELPAVVRANLQLWHGAWLADQRLYDEALFVLEPLELDQVADPATLLFYQSAVYYRLLNKDKGLPILQQLLELESQIPQRYAIVARLMEAELKPLKTDSLDEVARLMDNIHVRLGHGRAGKRVRTEEEDVVAKLDKMIEKLEEQRKKQQQQQQQQQQQKGGKKQAQQPMQDSQIAGGRGDGNVNPKKIKNKNDWGNLPPREREEILQPLQEQFPSHYREVIEEYFRKLAEQGTDDR